MNGDVQSVFQYLSRPQKFVIPVYQRNYDWKSQNCEQLFDDLERLQIEQKANHFFGTIVIKPGEQFNEEHIIDGQQRLTTVSILLLAMANWLEDNKDKLNGVRIQPDYILNKILKDEYLNGSDKIKLHSNPRDYEAYKNLFREVNMYKKTSNITINYEYFYKRIDKMNISIDELMYAIQKLQFMVVNLNSPTDDPQLIFESLNSTGVDLTDADKIRNYLLMNERVENQNFYFDNYWQHLEERAHYNLNDFFRYYITIKQSKFPRSDRTYETFKELYESLNMNKNDFFKEINSFSIAYKQVIESETESYEINDILNRFNELGVTVVRPFLIVLINDLLNHNIEEKEAVKVLEIIENYIARRIICKIPSNALNKVIASLYKDVYKVISKNDNEYNFSDILISILLSKKGSGRIPRDEEMLTSLKGADWYNIRPPYRNYLFERLENYQHNEPLSIFEGLRNHNYSIEHIMPQTLSDSWKKELGKNYEEIHTKYLNTLGNLTITGYNSKYSNHSFDEKKNMDKGFKHSHFTNLNQLPAHVDVWTASEIQERTNQLSELALEIWQYPKSSINNVKTSQNKEMIVYDGEETFTGSKIKGFSLIDDTYVPVNNWKEFFEEVFKKLITIDVSVLVRLSNIDNGKGIETIILSQEKQRTIKLRDNLYLYVNLSNVEKLGYIRQILDLYNINYEELRIDVSYK